MATEAVEITRYPNRRFYDRSRGQYVTLSEIEELVRGGQTVVVRDSKTGEDLTRAVLAQIILERHPERMDLFPVSMLHMVLQANDLVLDWMGNYLRQSMEFVERMTPSAALPPLMAPLAPPTAGSFPSPLDWMKAFFPAPGTSAGSPGADRGAQTAPRGNSSPPPEAGVGTSPRGEAKPGLEASGGEPAAAALLERLAELERRLSELESQRPA
jgi:polyhydroxyalkanoate synthesis repressor PhaR